MTVVFGYALLAVQFGSVAVEIAGAALILNEKLAVVATFKLSVAFTTAVKLPVAVGVPVIVPDAAPIVRPAGNPVADHVIGAVPLLLAMVVAGYARLTVQSWSVPAPDVIEGVWFNVSVNVFVSLAPALSVTVNCTLNVPAAVGVPVIAPPR